MKRFKNILLVCDEESVHEGLIARAIWLAKANGARITLVDLVDAAPGELAGMFSALAGSGAQDVEYEVLEFHRARLTRIGAAIRDEGIGTTELVLQGIPFVEVIRKVLRDGHDLVMKGVAGGTEGGSLFFASTDLHLLRKCPCPVWVMKEGAESRYARILAAVNPDQDDAPKGVLNTLIMDLATSLSQIDRSELHVVNVWRLIEEDTLRHSAFARVAESQVDLLVEEKRRQSEKELQGLLSNYPGGSTHRHVHSLKGEARYVIPEFAESKQVDLIVMGTVGRTGIRGLFIGNTAEAILNQVKCSVLAVKPPGFETPVRLS